MDVPGIALITAASGIGRACAKVFAREGVSGIALLDLTEETLLAVKSEIQELQRTLGQANPCRIETYSTNDWERILDVNLTGTFFVLRAAAKVMLKQEPIKSSIDGRSLQRGSIVNFSSIQGTWVFPCRLRIL
jgi:NAD(P)-dependent dehydrogenase (short-subunit alcohol dehydrogenase family)